MDGIVEEGGRKGKLPHGAESGTPERINRIGQPSTSPYIQIPTWLTVLFIFEIN